MRCCTRDEGRPLGAGGQVYDAKVLLEFLDWPGPLLAIAADKAYNGRAIRQAVTDEDALAVIPF